MDAKGIINYGLGKIGSSRVNSISPPSSPIERHCAAGYTQWKESELTKRRWVFARKFATLQVNPGVTPPDGYDFAYDLPSDYLHAIRDKNSQWIIGGLHLFANGEILLEYTRKAQEHEFHPLFIDALAARCAQECAEFITQSNTKGASADTLYEKAIKQAGIANALILGSEDAKHAEYMDDWELARAGYLP